MNTSFLQETVAALDAAGLKRRLRFVSSMQDRQIDIDGARVINFCSNNYLGLASDPRIIAVAHEALSQYGMGAGASRLICGNIEPHQRLEQRLAEFKGSEAALVFSAGYMANVGTIAALFGRDDIVFSDRLNHASIVDGIILSRAEHKRYAHRDMDALEALLRASSGYKKRGIITDSVFSMDGDVAPLEAIVALARKYDCLVMVDEAHAFGVFGENGTGLVEHCGLGNEIPVQMGTLSKAAGSFGAYVCGSRELIDYLVNHTRSFIYTTGMPPAIAAASQRAVDIIEQEPERRENLWKNTRYVQDTLTSMGFDTLHSASPIIPIVVEDNARAVDFSKRLFARGIFVSAIRPPTVPRNTARLRVTIMATHTQDDLDILLENCLTVGKELCII